MKPFSDWDFTLQTYVQLCRTILESGYKIVTVCDYLTERKNFLKDYVVLLRHDVDRKPSNALNMAQVEADLGITSTYYFRAKKHTFKPEIIKGIAQLGHEIGYHYECLSDMHGKMERAIRDFERNLNKFKEIVPLKTICMHGSPLSKWNNRDLWKKYDFRDFGIIGEPYLSLDYSRIAYVSDTGRTWNVDHFNVRDRVKSDRERWAISRAEWAWSFTSDCVANYIKILISKTWGR